MKRTFSVLLSMMLLLIPVISLADFCTIELDPFVSAALGDTLMNAVAGIEGVTANQNEDGTVTIVMPEETRDQYLGVLADTVTELTDSFKENSDAFVSVSCDGELKVFTVVCNDQYSELDMIGALPLAIAGGAYQMFAGVAPENVDVTVRFVDKAGAELQTSTYAETAELLSLFM